MNVEKGFFRLWLVIMVIGMSVLACYTSCDGTYIKQHEIAFAILTAGAAIWALRGFAPSKKANGAD